MRRHIQTPGIRNWYGEDLIELQSVPMEVIDSFFTQYGDFIVSGCEVTAAGSGKYNISSGLLALSRSDSALTAKAVVKFDEQREVELPLYVSLNYRTEPRKYLDNQDHEVTEIYGCDIHGFAPAENYLVLNATGNRRLTDAITDADHRFVTDSDKTNWNAKETPAGAQQKASQAQANAKIYTDEKAEETFNRANAASTELNQITKNELDHAYAGYDYILYPGDDLSILDQNSGVNISGNVLLKSGLYYFIKKGDETHLRLKSGIKSITGEPGGMIWLRGDNCVWATHNDCSLENLYLVYEPNRNYPACGSLYGFKGIRNCRISVMAHLFTVPNDMAVLDNCSDIINCEIAVYAYSWQSYPKNILSNCENIIDSQITAYHSYKYDGGVLITDRGSNITRVTGIKNCTFTSCKISDSENIDGCLFVDTVISYSSNICNSHIKLIKGSMMDAHMENCNGVRYCSGIFWASYSNYTYGSNFLCADTAEGGFNRVIRDYFEEMTDNAPGRNMVTGADCHNGYYYHLPDKAETGLKKGFTVETLFTTGSKCNGSVVQIASHFRVYISGNTMYLSCGEAVNLGPCSPNTTYHIMFVNDPGASSSGVKCYLNGKYVGGHNIAIAPDTYRGIYLGGDNSSSGNFFQGTVHRFQLFESVFTEDQLMVLWNNGKPQYYKEAFVHTNLDIEDKGNWGAAANKRCYVSFSTVGITSEKWSSIIPFHYYERDENLILLKGHSPEFSKVVPTL